MSGAGWIPRAVVAAIAARPAARPRAAGRTEPPRLQPLELGQLPPPPRIPLADDCRRRRHRPSTLILYDPTGRWGWLGELYATLTANLAGTSVAGRPSRSPTTAAARSSDTRASSTSDRRTASRCPRFLDDVLRTRRPVLWVNDNILQLRRGQATSPRGTAGARRARPLDVAEVRYKGTSLTRWSRQTPGSCAARRPARAPRAREARPRRRLDIPVGHSLAEPHLRRRAAFRVHERDRSRPRLCGPPLRRARAADA